MNEIYIKDLNFYKLLCNYNTILEEVLAFVKLKIEKNQNLALLLERVRSRDKRDFNGEEIDEDNQIVISIFGKNFQLRIEFLKLLFNLSKDFLFSNYEEILGYFSLNLKDAFVFNLKNKNNDGELLHLNMLQYYYENQDSN